MSRVDDDRGWTPQPQICANCLNKNDGEGVFCKPCANIFKRLSESSQRQ